MLPTEPVLTVDILLDLPLFRGESPDALEWLLHTATLRTLAEGEILLETGQINNTLFLILHGQLRIQLDTAGMQNLALLDAGDCVGELSLLDGAPVSAYVVAACDCRLLLIPEASLWRLISRSHVVARNLLYTLALRVRKDNTVILQSLAQQKLHEQNAKLDALTGLHNRRWLDDMLPRMIERATRSQHPLSLMMIDADHFKQFNDQHGHLAGDNALRHIAHIIQQQIRPSDFAARYGGEEFTVLLPDTKITHAHIVAQRLCRGVGSCPIKNIDSATLPAISISIGLTQLTPGQGTEALLATADTALYQAKRAGRNRVIHTGDSGPTA